MQRLIHVFSLILSCIIRRVITYPQRPYVLVPYILIATHEGGEILPLQSFPVPECTLGMYDVIRGRGISSGHFSIGLKKLSKAHVSIG
jgi:hypothetical protein